MTTYTIEGDNRYHTEDCNIFKNYMDNDSNRYKYNLYTCTCDAEDDGYEPCDCIKMYYRNEGITKLMEDAQENATRKGFKIYEDNLELYIRSDFDVWRLEDVINSYYGQKKYLLYHKNHTFDHMHFGDYHKQSELKSKLPGSNGLKEVFGYIKRHDKRLHQMGYRLIVRTVKTVSAVKGTGDNISKCHQKLRSS